MDLKSKLNLYSSQAQQTEIIENDTAPLVTAGGEKIAVANQHIWRFESRLSSERVYDPAVAKISQNLSSLFTLNSFDSTISLDDLLFFDLETTSLSTGTGNYPFLCGIGYTDGDDFICEQLFMESYGDETAILSYLMDFFNRSKAVVSFNGNSFDLPLIKNRYMINRVYGFPVTIPSFDLIVPSRRIFKSLYENCALQTIEKNVIGFTREGDTPGWMVPEIYFSFQKDGNAERLPGVIEHNRYDIFSMYILIQILAEIFSDIQKGDYSSMEKGSLFSLARYFYRISPDIFLDLTTYLGLDIRDDRGVFERFSITLKRKEEWEKAIDYWEKDASLFSLIELAKYYEHRAKDLDRALHYAEEALKLAALIPKEKEKGEEEKILKRKNRLLKRKNR